MAVLVLIDPFISIGGVNLSEHFTSVSIEPSAALQESTAFGDEWMTREGGLKDFSMSGDYNQDYAAGAIDATLWPLLGVSTPIIVRSQSGAVSVTNPQWAGNVLLESYMPVGGSVGDLVTGSVTLPGNGPLARTTS